MNQTKDTSSIPTSSAAQMVLMYENEIKSLKEEIEKLRWKKMKLFIWEDPYTIQYGHSLLFAVAENEEQAKELLDVKAVNRASEIADFDNKIRKEIERDGLHLKKADMVLDLPCAFIHTFAE